MKFLIFSIFFILITSSCVKNNPDPSWVEVNNWTLIENSEDTPERMGELTHNFSEASIYIDGKLLGIFEVPFKIPVLKSGETKITLLPTIKDNGISATKVSYPLVEKFETTVYLEKNKSTVINPITKYYKDVTCWKIDFEDATVNLDYDPNNTAYLISETNNPIIKYGNSCGRIKLNASNNHLFCFTNEAIPIVKGNNTYLEIDYYNTNEIVTGARLINADDSYKDNINIQLNKQDLSEIKWKKIYVSLKEVLTNSGNAKKFKIFFDANYNNIYTDTDIFIDNIKIVGF